MVSEPESIIQDPIIGYREASFIESLDADNKFKMVEDPVGFDSSTIFIGINFISHLFDYLVGREVPPVAIISNSFEEQGIIGHIKPWAAYMSVRC